MSNMTRQNRSKIEHSFHQLIDTHIKDKGLLQRFIARQLGISGTFLSRWKQDRFPTFEILIQFCTLLDLSKKEKRGLIHAYILGRMHREAIKAYHYLDARLESLNP